MTPAPGWGADEPTPEQWRHGPWGILRSGDELADITWRGRRVLRSVRAVVRDRQWRTVPPFLESVHAVDGALRLGLRFAGLGADLRGELVASGIDVGLRIALTLRSHSPFDRARIGLVVLHPADLAGHDLTAEHTDGTRTATTFPVDIAPHQPAMDVRALAWSADGLRARLAFAGDVFEMEDQRNWTDASFKSYSTPLALPFPVLVQEGDEIRQQIEVRCEVTGATRTEADPAVIDLALRGDRLPVFTLGATTESSPLPLVGGAALLVELSADRPTWRSALARAAEEAGGGGLDVRIVADRPDAVRAVVDELAALQRRGTPIVRAGVFSPTTHLTEPDTWAALRDRAAEVGLLAALLGGTRAHFTELNRGYAQLPADLPALTFSSTPQMHAVEARQLVESIDMQRLTAQNALRIAAGRPVHIGPITLRPRFNAVATTPDSRVASGAAPDPSAPDPSATDPRQSSAALAAWTVASAAAVALPRIGSATYFEASGPRGLRSLDGTDFPVCTAMQQVMQLSGAEAVAPSALPRDVHLLAGVAGGAVVALVANLRVEAVTVTLRFAGKERRATVQPLEYQRCVWRPAD